MNGKELIKALNTIVEEKNISADIIFEALELALQTAYKKNFNFLPSGRTLSVTSYFKPSQI